MNDPYPGFRSKMEEIAQQVGLSEALEFAERAAEVGEIDDSVGSDAIDSKLHQFIARTWPGMAEAETLFRWSGSKSKRTTSMCPARAAA